MIDSGKYRSAGDGNTASESPSEAKDTGDALWNSHDEDVFRRYSQALRFAAEDQAISQGSTYDLCYCNFSSDGFDKDRHFVWLRDHEEETLLIAANFSRREAHMKLRIPDHAFEWLGMPTTDKLNPDTVLNVTVPAMDGVIIRLCPDNELA